MKTISVAFEGDPKSERGATLYVAMLQDDPEMRNVLRSAASEFCATLYRHGWYVVPQVYGPDLVGE